MRPQTALRSPAVGLPVARAGRGARRFGIGLPRAPAWARRPPPVARDRNRQRGFDARRGHARGRSRLRGADRPRSRDDPFARRGRPPRRRAGAGGLAGARADAPVPSDARPAGDHQPLPAARIQWFYEALLATFAKTYDLGTRSDPTTFYCYDVFAKYYPFDGTPRSPIAINYGYATDAANVRGTVQLQLDYRVLGRRDRGGQGDGQASLPGAFSLSLMEEFPADYDFTSSSKDPPAGFFQPRLYRWTFAPPSRDHDAC